MATQTQRGKAFEYELAYALSQKANLSLAMSPHWMTAYQHAQDNPDATQFELGAQAAANLLVERNSKLRTQGQRIWIHSSKAGKHGDVRDLIVDLSSGEKIGLSAKVNNSAVKNTRPSPKNDLFMNWAGVGSSDEYWHNTQGIWNMLREGKKQRLLFKDLLNKDMLYSLFISALEKEFECVSKNHPSAIPTLFMSILGQHDLYKVVLRTRRRVVEIQPFNWNGTLGLSEAKIKPPTHLQAAYCKPDSTTTLLVSFDQGWQLSFRVHNASSKVEHSLKLDIQLVGVPPVLTLYEVSY